MFVTRVPTLRLDSYACTRTMAWCGGGDLVHVPAANLQKAAITRNYPSQKCGERRNASSLDVRFPSGCTRYLLRPSHGHTMRCTHHYLAVFGVVT